MKGLFFSFSRIPGKNTLASDINEQRPLSILEDGVFKAMLTANSIEAREALKALLSACTHRQVTAFKIDNNELLPAHLGAKSARLDVHVTFNNGEIADMEMQVQKTDDGVKARAEVYAAMLLSGQTRRGKRYKESRRVYQIFFLNFNLFPNSSKLPRRYAYREEEEHDRLSDVTEIIFYEFPKLEQRVRDYAVGKVDMKTLSKEEKWCIFMRYRHEKRASELIKELCQKEAGIMCAEKAVAKVSWSYRRFARKMAEIKNSMDYASDLYEAKLKVEKKVKAEFRAEGRAEGITQASLDIARNALAEGASPEFVQKITGLDMQTITGLS
jgi:predicted transposase/invertase (TIGR01784 family)